MSPSMVRVLLGVTVAGAIVATAVTAIATAPRPQDTPVMADNRSTAVAHGTMPVDTAFYDSLAALTRRVESQTADTAVALRLARLLSGAHRPAEAIEYYRLYLDHRPAARLVRFDLAAALGATGAWDAAAAVLREGLQHAPDDTEMLYNLGAVAANRGRFDEARAWWQRAATYAQPGFTLSASIADALRRVDRLDAR